MANDRQDRSRLASAYQARGVDLDKINDRSPWHRLYRVLTAEYLASLRAPIPKAIDLAAGTGITAELLCQLGYEVAAVETLPIMLGILRRKAARMGIDVFDVDLTKSGDFRPSGFGLATCTQALNFFPQLEPVFSFAKNCLSPGGVLYFDIDTRYRWAVIEALVGHPLNALSILNEGFDASRQIVGADYFFHSEREIADALERSGFSDISVDGILPLVPLLHVFNESADFLDHSKLLTAAARYASEDGLNELRRLDEKVREMVPPDLCGWLRFTAIRY